MLFRSNRYYACKICHTNVVWRLFNIRKHMESSHELTLDQYGSLYEGATSPEAKPVSRGQVQAREVETMWYEGSDQYQCLICRAKIAHKYNNIASHMTLIHDLSMPEYEKEMMARDEAATHFLAQENVEDQEEEEDQQEE